MRGTVRHFAFARALFGANLKASLAQRGVFLMQVVFMMLNNATFFVFWWALMHRVPHLRGWRLGDIQVLFGIVAIGFGPAVTFAGGVRHLGRFIHEGELDTLLTQPRPVRPYALFGGVLRLMLFTVLPAGFVGYMPAHVAQHPSVGGVLVLLLVAAGYMCVAAIVFERGLRHYTSGSRFGTFG